MLQALNVFTGVAGLTGHNGVIRSENTSESEVTREGAWQAFLNLRESAKRNGLQDMTQDEIEAEIQLARTDVNALCRD